MTITKSQEANVVTLAVEGRLDTTTAPQLDSCINELENVEELVLDFKQLAYISSAGLRVLLSAQKSMNKKQGKMIVRGACEDVLEVFDITGFSDILTIE